MEYVAIVFNIGIEAETKWPAISWRLFQIDFFIENVWTSIAFSLKFVPRGPIDIYASTVSDNDLTAIRRQSIIWTNDGSFTDTYTRSTHRFHDDVIKWKHFPRHWSSVRGIHRSSVNSPQGQWRGALMFSLICAWIKAWVNNREASWFIYPIHGPL